MKEFLSLFKKNFIDEPQSKKASLRLIKKTMLSLFTLTLTALVTFVAVVAYRDMSFGWYAKNRNVRAGGMDLSLDTPGDMEVVIEVYNVAGKEGDTVYFYSGKENDLNAPVDAKVYMPQYQLLDEVNRYMLFHMIISSSTEQEIRLTMSTPTEYFMDSEHPLIGKYGPGGSGIGETYQNCLSSIVEFGYYESAGIESATISAANRPADATGDLSGNFYKLDLSDTEFVGFANENADGEMEITDTLDIGSRFNLTTDSEGNIIHDLYIIVAYNDYNVNLVYSANIGNDIQVDELGIVFIADITFGLIFGDSVNEN